MEVVKVAWHMVKIKREIDVIGSEHSDDEVDTHQMAKSAKENVQHRYKIACK